MIRLFINWYTEKKQPRGKELNQCLENNFHSPFIDEIINLSDTKLPEGKIKNITAEGRPTYNDFLKAIADIARPNDISIIANLDIYFDETVKLCNKMDERDVYALTRWDVWDEKGKDITFLNRQDSQDAWCFKGKPKLIPAASFGIGVPGCLSGDTIIKYSRGNKRGSREIELSRLYHKFNQLPCKGKGWGPEFDTLIHSFNESANTVCKNKIEAVLESGVKETVKILFEDNSEIVLTPDHRLLTQNGFFDARDLMPNSEVVCVGSMLPIPSGQKRTYKKRKEVYAKYHPYANKTVVRGHTYFKIRNYRVVIEADMNKMPYDKFLEVVNSNKEAASKFLFLSTEYEVHHKDEDTLNDEPNNLEVLSKEEHSRLHGRNENFHTDYIRFKKIKSIEAFGRTMTYDIKMSLPHNNFAANEVIVHNCDNAFAHLLKRNGYRVSNPSLSIKAYHYHRDARRNYKIGNKQLVASAPEPYLLISPSKLQMV